MPADRHLSPAETAAQFGVTVRALRVYERHGLLTPLRTQAGWRVYGPVQLARLHQVLALKRLGLSLARIGELLAGRLAALDSVLALQEAALKARRAEADTGLRYLAEARRRLAEGGCLSLDDLTRLTRETTMSERLSDQEWVEIFDPLIAKYYTAEEIEQLKTQKSEMTEAPDWDGDFKGGWDALIAEAGRLMAVGDPGSPAAADLARRWMAEVDKFTGGDPALNAKSAAMWQDALADPSTARRLPITPEMFAFVGDAYRRRKAAAG